jgi:hypothetical protein
MRQTPGEKTPPWWLRVWPLNHAGKCLPNVVILIHFPISVKQYAQASTCPGREIPLPEQCPQPDCQARLCLIRWGSYRRWVSASDGDYQVRIQRVRCNACGCTHSLLPDFLHPFRHYELALLQQVIQLYLLAGRGFGQIMAALPEAGPALSTIREWVQAFAYGAGYLLAGLLSRSLLTIAPAAELPGPAPPHLNRSRHRDLPSAWSAWQMTEQLYALVKLRHPRLHFSAAHTLTFGLHWLQSQASPPRFFWSPRLKTTPTAPF